MSGPTFKNKLERLENSHRMARHRAMLQDIARATQRDYAAKQPYR